MNRVGQLASRSSRTNGWESIERPRSPARALFGMLGGFAAAWLAHNQLEPWRKAAGKNGGAPYRRAERIYAAALIASFLGGGIVTRLVLLWLG
jgi:hypothetical protein